MAANRQRLTEEQRAIIKNDYLAGLKPAAIADKLGVKVSTVRQGIWREGLTAQREEIKDAAARTAGEVIEDARARHAGKLAGIMDRQIEALVSDSERLRDGWHLVSDAAGASALMRSKVLLQDRTLRHFGLGGGHDGQAAGASLNLFLVRGERDARYMREAPAVKVIGAAQAVIDIAPVQPTQPQLTK